MVFGDLSVAELPRAELVCLGRGGESGRSVSCVWEYRSNTWWQISAAIQSIQKNFNLAMNNF